MNKPRAYFLSSLMIIVFSIQSGAMQSTGLKGMVLLQDSTPLSGVSISVNNHEVSVTGNDGEFFVAGYDLSQKPKSVSAIRDGYELATWSFHEKILSVVMKPATFKVIEGALVDLNNTPLANKQILYKGLTNQSTFTDEKGNYSLKIPIDEKFDPKGRILVDNQSASILSYLPHKDKPAYLTIQSTAGNKEYQIFNVTVLQSNGTSYANQFVEIGDESYITDDKGAFRIKAANDPNVKWNIGDQKIRTIDTIKASNQITVRLLNTASVVPQDSTLPSDSLISSISDELKESMDRLSHFYQEEEEILNQHQEQINKINRHLPKITDISSSEKEQLYNELVALNKSMESTTKTFDETKRMHNEMILKLQKLLIEKEIAIEDIKKEKEDLETQFDFNLKLYSLILFIVLGVLAIVIWVLRRFKKQNIIIQRTQKELVRAQEMAHIGNMVYSPDEHHFTYSDNFLNTLKIRNQDKIDELKKATDGLIHETIIAEDDRDKVKETWMRGLQNKKPISIEFKSNADTQEDVHIDMKTIFETNNHDEITHISSTLQDISLIKENEIKLINAINEAEQAGKVKEEFLASMSHEIRTPLNAIIGLTNRLISLKPSDHQRKNLEIIQMSSEHLLALINDVLDFSKIQAGKVRIELTPFNLMETISNTSNALLLNARERGIDLIIEQNDKLPQVVKSDKLRINQIMMNLLSNAIKFTSEGSVTVKLKSTPSKGKKHQITFSVIDTGIGIDQEKLESIFESFEQENISTSRKYGGTGLGLSISKSLVELLGGKLKVRSEIDKGSEFYFTLELEEVDAPIKRKASPKSREELSELYNLNGVKVLCVEDNEINQMVISQYFTVFGVRAIYAATGQEAIDKYEANEFDLVLMDIRLPDMTGYEACREIKSRFPDRNTPIVAFTAEVDVKTEDRIKEVGMVDYLGKPFKEEDLYTVISKHIIND